MTMNLLGIHLAVLIGPTLAVPAPPPILEALQRVEVTHSDQQRSGFQLVFEMGRSGPLGAMDFPLLSNPLLRPFNRVVLVAAFNAIPRVLMDGIITNHQLSPQAGGGTLTVTGEDVSVMMDMEEKTAEHPAQPEMVIALKLIGTYAKYGLIPMVLPPPTINVPLPIEQIPVQSGVTDLRYLNMLAERYGYVFYIEPGPLPLTNKAYWGPPIRAGIPQRALNVDLGPETNVDEISFQNDALAPANVSTRVQDRQTGQDIPVETFFSSRLPLSSQPSWLANQPNVRKVQQRTSGLNALQAFARAQGAMDASTDAVGASGTLDALRYGGLLQPRALVGLRGAGYTNDGFYYVQSVTHVIQHGSYTQRFSLKREGVGSLSPVVVP